MHTPEYTAGTDEFDSERLRVHHGRVLNLPEVMELTGVGQENIIRAAMAEGTLPYIVLGNDLVFHEDDVRAYVQHRWEDARERARQARVARRVQERYRRWQESGAEGTWELRTCPECGTVMLLRAPNESDVDGLEFWQGDRFGECSFCRWSGYFATREPSECDRPF